MSTNSTFCSTSDDWSFCYDYPGTGLARCYRNLHVNSTDRPLVSAHGGVIDGVCNCDQLLALTGENCDQLNWETTVAIIVKLILIVIMAVISAKEAHILVKVHQLGVLKYDTLFVCMILTMGIFLVISLCLIFDTLATVYVDRKLLLFPLQAIWFGLLLIVVFFSVFTKYIIDIARSARIFRTRRQDKWLRFFWYQNFASCVAYFVIVLLLQFKVRIVEDKEGNDIFTAFWFPFQFGGWLGGFYMGSTCIINTITIASSRKETRNMTSDVKGAAASSSNSLLELIANIRKLRRKLVTSFFCVLIALTISGSLISDYNHKLGVLPVCSLFLMYISFVGIIHDCLDFLQSRYKKLLKNNRKGTFSAVDTKLATVAGTKVQPSGASMFASSAVSGTIIEEDSSEAD